jgi:hypothetical protein
MIEKNLAARKRKDLSRIDKNLEARKQKGLNRIDNIWAL